MSASEFTWVEQKLNCILCHKTAEHPQILNCCGSIGCEKCLGTHFETSDKCPSCCSTCSEGAYMHLPFLDNLVASLPVFKQFTAVQVFCDRHSKAEAYFCSECKEYLCSDCIYEVYSGTSKKHAGHSIRKISEMASEIAKGLSEKLVQLDAAQALVQANAGLLVDFASRLVSFKDDILLGMYDRFHMMQDSFSASVEIFSSELERQKNRVERQSMTLEKLENDCLDAMKSNDIGVISKAEEFLEEVRNVDKLVRAAAKIPPVVPDNDIVPPFASAVVRFDHFKSIRSNRLLEADPVEISCSRWKLKIYPFGQNDQAARYASVFLELVGGFTEECHVCYRVMIESVSGQRPPIVQECAVVTKVGQSWGWKRFGLVSDIMSGYYTDRKGALSITIGVRPDSYYTLWRWLTWDTHEKRTKILEYREKKGH